MVVLVKCYDIKMVLLPFYLFIKSLIKPEATNQQKKLYFLSATHTVNLRNLEIPLTLALNTLNNTKIKKYTLEYVTK